MIFSLYKKIILHLISHMIDFFLTRHLEFCDMTKLSQKNIVCGSLLQKISFAMEVDMTTCDGSMTLQKKFAMTFYFLQL